MSQDLLHFFDTGFPDQWITTAFEKSLAKNFYTSIFGSSPGMIVNATWINLPMPDHFPGSSIMKGDHVLRTLRKNPDVKNVLLYSFTDQADYYAWPYIEKLQDACNLHVVGQAPSSTNNHIYFPYWYVVSKKFFKITEPVEPTEFQNLYLCYNRKPHWHRVKLLRDFYTNGILDKGVFTMGKNHKIKDLPSTLTFDGNTPNNYEAYICADDQQWNIVADAFTLGNMKIWQQSFLNIVNETSALPPHMIPEGQTVTPFLSEKVFKPIAGKRPFVVNGDPGVDELLKQLGFELFEDLVTMENLVDFVYSTDINECNSLYKKHYAKIEHNYQHFHNLINTLKDEFSFLDTCLNV